MIGTAFKKTILRALLLASAGALTASAGAPAATGGVSPPSGATGSAPLVIHRTAIATWFGPGFYGQRTACGQTLTPVVVGVANRTLPCGTLVKVSYKGRRLIVPVIDRGPYAHNGADWDLTTEAAHQLGMEDTARIGARVVGSVPNTPTLGLPAVAPAVSATGGASAG